MEFVKMVGKVVVALLVLALAAAFFGCSSSLEVSSGITSLDESYRARELAIAQIAYLKESGDSVNRDQIRQIEEALTKQSVALLGREKSARFNLSTSDAIQAPELFREFQATEGNPVAQQSSQSAQLNGLAMNKRNEDVVVRIKGPNNWFWEGLIKAQSRVEIPLLFYGDYQVVFLNGYNVSSAVLPKEVRPNKHYFDDGGNRYDLMAIVFQ